MLIGLTGVWLNENAARHGHHSHRFSTWCARNCDHHLLVFVTTIYVDYLPNRGSHAFRLASSGQW